MNRTAIEMLKANGINPVRDMPSMHENLKQWFVDKQYSTEVIEKMGKTKVFGELFQKFVLRRYKTDDSPLYNYFAANNRTITRSSHSEFPVDTYRGSGQQNKEIDKALASSPDPHLYANGNEFFGEGAAGFLTFSRTETPHLPASVTSQKIAIIGNGAAGIMTRRALHQLGFRNVTVFEKKSDLGIWNQPNVFQRSRNNPKYLQFFGQPLNPAPGPGLEVKDFLNNLLSLLPTRATPNQSVEKVVPKNYSHQVFLSQEGKQAQLDLGETFPIIINCIGLGKPKPLSDPNRMVVKQSATEALAQRWQKTITKADIQRKKIVMVGLGNSTAEMLRQIHQLQDSESADVDYEILTHYPEEAIQDPNATVVKGKKQFRVFRDISRPNLVDYQGDLRDNKADYFRALRGGKIKTNVKGWERVNSSTLKLVINKDTIHGTGVNDFYVLTGFTQQADILNNLGLGFKKAQKAEIVERVFYDYDGEFHAVGGEESYSNLRLAKGYFGMGAILDSEYNRNAIVIPGIIARMGDMLFSVIVRAYEAAELQSGEKLVDE